MRLGERNQWRLSEIGRPVFWLDTIPLHEVRAASRVIFAQCPPNFRHTSTRFPQGVRPNVPRDFRMIAASLPDDIRAASAQRLKCPRNSCGSVRVASTQCPRPQSVHARIESATTTAVCSWTRTVRVVPWQCPRVLHELGQPTDANHPPPRTVHRRVQSVTTNRPRTVHVLATSASPTCHRPEPSKKHLSPQAVRRSRKLCEAIPINRLARPQS